MATHYWMKLPYKESLTWIFPERYSTAEIHLFIFISKQEIFSNLATKDFYLIDLIEIGIFYIGFKFVRINCRKRIF